MISVTSGLSELRYLSSICPPILKADSEVIIDIGIVKISHAMREKWGYQK